LVNSECCAKGAHNVHNSVSENFDQRTVFCHGNDAGLEITQSQFDIQDGQNGIRKSSRRFSP
jgi:hypothetical protein